MISVFDGSGLNVGIKVRDSEVKADSPDPWLNDSVEVFCDFFNDRQKVYNADDRRIVVDAKGRMHVVGCSQWIRKAVRPVEDGYTVEIQISPWNLGGYGGELRPLPPALRPAAPGAEQPQRSTVRNGIAVSSVPAL